MKKIAIIPIDKTDQQQEILAVLAHEYIGNKFSCEHATIKWDSSQCGSKANQYIMQREIQGFVKGYLRSK